MTIGCRTLTSSPLGLPRCTGIHEWIAVATCRYRGVVGIWSHSIIDSTIDVPSGTSVVGVEFRRAKKDATVALLVNNQKVGELQIPAIMRMISSVGASIGRDEGSTISKRYADEFTFRGKIHRLDIQLLTENRAEASVNAETSQRETMGRQ